MQGTRYQERTRGLQVADAGLNEYLYRMSINYDYNTPISATLADGSSYSASRTVAPDGLALITSVARLVDGTTRTVKARCAPPSFADYALASTGDMLVGPDTVIEGPVRTNGKISWSSGGTKSLIMGRAQSPVGYYKYSGGNNYSPSTDGNHFKGGVVPIAQAGTLNFDKVSTDIDAMKSKAGLLLRESATVDGLTPTAIGYEIVFAGNQVQVKRVLSENHVTNSSTNLGRLTLDTRTQTQATYAIPANGVIFVENDNVWVRGTYSSRVTICASRSSSTDTKNSGCITVSNSVLCDNKTTSSVTCGLLAQNSIWLPSWYSRTDASSGVMDPVLTIESAMLAQNGSIGDGFSDRFGNGHPPVPQPYHDLSISGASVGRNGVGFTASGNEGTSKQTYGFRYRTYGFDPRLKTSPPPSWPKTGDTVVVASWVEG